MHRLVPAWISSRTHLGNMPASRPSATRVPGRRFAAAGAWSSSPGPSFFGLSVPGPASFGPTFPGPLSSGPLSPELQPPASACLELFSWGLFALGWDTDTPANLEDSTLDPSRALERFLLDTEKRAFRIARIAVRNDDDALDIVQDAMLQLARRYGRRPCQEWRPLFYRILQNRIRDCLRRRKVRSRVMAWLPHWREDGEGRQPDPWNDVPDGRPQPAERVAADEAMELLEGALADLPARQREAFILRTLEGLDVAQTAQAMSCSEGSVKTHYSRAVHRLRDLLGSAW